MLSFGCPNNVLVCKPEIIGLISLHHFCTLYIQHKYLNTSYMVEQKTFDALLFTLWTRQTHKLYVCFRVVRTDGVAAGCVYKLFYGRDTTSHARTPLDPTSVSICHQEVMYCYRAALTRHAKVLITKVSHPSICHLCKSYNYGSSCPIEAVKLAQIQLSQ